jgi:hypothetical protein
MYAPATRHAGGRSPAAITRRGSVGKARLAFEITIAYARAHRALRRTEIADVVQTLRRPPTASAEPSGEALIEAGRLGRAVSRTLRFVPGDTRCLVRSLVLSQLLAKRGLESRLVIGARSEPDFLAHAWVECDGVPVLSPGDGSFARLVDL